MLDERRADVQFVDDSCGTIHVRTALRILMAVIRDVMPAFELFQPASVDDALALLDRYGATRGCWPAASTASTGSRTASSARRSSSI